MGNEREHVPSEQQHRASAPAQAEEHAEPAVAEAAGNRAVTQLLRDAGVVPPAPPGGPGGGSSGASSTPNAPPSQGAGPLDPATGAAIDSARGGGWTLPDALRAEIEHHLGVDLRPVRLHTGAQAAALTDAVQAEAFTTGSDIFFGAGRYDPVGRGGRELLAHELTHVAQQATGGIGIQHQDAEVSHPDDAAEVEARGMASRIASALEAPRATDPDALIRPDDAGPAPDPDALMRPDGSGQASDPDGLISPAAGTPDPDALMPLDDRDGLMPLAGPGPAARRGPAGPGAPAAARDALMRPGAPGPAPDPDALMQPDDEAADPDALMSPEAAGPDPDALMPPDDPASEPDPDGLMRPDGPTADSPQGTVAVRPSQADPMPVEEDPMPVEEPASAGAGGSFLDSVNDLIATAGAMLAGAFAGLGGPAAAPAGPASGMAAAAGAPAAAGSPASAGVATGAAGPAGSGQSGAAGAPDAISGASPAGPVPDAISGAGPAVPAPDATSGASPAGPVPDAISGAGPVVPVPDAISGAGPVVPAPDAISGASPAVPAPAGSGPDAISGAGGRQPAGQQVRNRADVERVLTPRPVSVPPPSPHVADPGVAGWKQRTRLRIAGIRPADTRKITAAPAQLQGKAKDVQAKNAEAAAPDLAADNQKVVPKQPVPEQPLPPPPPDPVPAATELMTTAAKLRLPDQAMPQLGASPQVVDATYQVKVDGLRPGEMPPPPPAEPAALPAGAPALGPDESGKKMAQAKDSATAPKPEPTGTAAPAAPVTLTDAGPTPPLSVAPGVQADLTAALAKLAVGVPQSATRIVHAGLAQAMPREIMLQVAPQLGAKEQPALEQEMAAELAGIATEAGVAATTLDASVADLRARAAAETADAQQQLAAEDATHRSAIGQQAQAQQAQVAGVSAATQQQIDEAVQAGSGQADPAHVDGQAKQLLQKVHTDAETVRANLRLAFEQRQRDLDKWIAGQAGAANDTATAQARRIRDAFEHSSYKPSEDAAEATKQRREAGLSAAASTITWAHRNQVAAADAGAELKRTAERLYHEQQDQVTQLGGQAATAVQDWRDQRLGEERSWWEQQDERVKVWSNQAAADNKIWEQVRDRDTAARALRDADLISKIRTAVNDQNQAELYKLLSGLDGAQRTVAQICLNGGDVVDALAAGTLSRIAERRVPELAERLRAEALELPQWADLEALGAAQNPEFNATAAAIEVHAGVDGAGTKEEKIYHALGGRTPIQIQAIKLRYAVLYGDDLFADVHGDMDVDNDEGKRADALLHSDAVGAEVAEFRDQIASVNDLARILRGKTPEQVREFRRRYEKQYDATIEHDISHVLLTPADQARLKALLAGDTAQADAIALGQAVRTKDSDRFDGNEFSLPTASSGPFNNYAGTRSEDNSKAALAVLHQIRDEVDAEAARTGMTSEDRRQELRRRYSEVQAKYGAMLGTSLSEAIQDQLSDDKAGQADAMLAGNDWGADAWAMRDELDSYNINYKKVGEAVTHERGLVEKNARRDAEAKFEVELRTEEWGTDKAEVDRRRKAMAGEVDAAADKRAEAVMGAMGNVIGEDNMSRLQPVKPPSGGMAAFAMPVLPNPNQDQAAALFAKAGKLSAAERMDFAIRRRDEDAIKEALKDPANSSKLRSKAEMATLREEYQKHTGRSMDADLDRALSGRAAFDIGLDVRGEPADEKETVARLRERQKWEMDNSRSNSFLDYASAAAGVSPELRKSMVTPEERALDITVTDAERAAAEVTATKNSGDKEQAKLAEEALTRRVGGVTAAIEDQRRAIDSTAEMAAMIAGIAAGIIVVVASGGSLAPGVMALAAAASTVTSIAVKRTVLGEAYGADQFGKDIALGAIDVAAAVLTAGTANYLLRSSMLAGAVRAGGVSRLLATVSAQGIEAGLAGIPHGIADAMMSGALESDDPLGTLARAAGMSVLTSAAMGGGMAVAHGAVHAATGRGGVTHAPPPEALGETPQLRQARSLAKTSTEGATAEGVIDAPDRVAARPVPAEPSVVVTDQGGAASARPAAEPVRGHADQIGGQRVRANEASGAIGNDTVLPGAEPARPAEPSRGHADQIGGQRVRANEASGAIGNDTVLPGAEPARPAEPSRGHADQIGGQRVRANEASGTIGNDTVLVEPDTTRGHADQIGGERVRANEASGTIGNDTVLAEPSRGQAEHIGGERASGNEASGTIGNDAELPQTVEVRNRRIDQWVQNGMPQYYGDGSPQGYTIDAGFDTRTYTNNGQPITEISMRVKLVPRAGVTAADIARVQQNALTGVDHVFNSGHVLPNGERMQVKVEFVDKAADAHLVVDLGPGYGRPRQNEWYVDNHPVEVAHELAHQTGLIDEYIDPIALNRSDPSAGGVHNDSIMSDFFIRDANGNAIGVDMQKATLQQRHIQQIAGDIAAAQAAQAAAPAGAGTGAGTPGNAAPAPRAGGGAGGGRNWRPAATTIEQVATLLTERPELLSAQGLRTRYDLLANETTRVLEAYRAGRSLSGERIGSPPELAGQMAELEGLLALQTTDQIATATPIERFLALEELRASMARAGETLRSYEHAFTAEVSGDELPGRRPAGQPEPAAEPGAPENRYERSQRIADHARGTDVAGMPVADIVEMLRFAEPTVTARGIVGEALERTLPGVGLNSKAPTPSSIAAWHTQPPELAARLAAMFAGYQEAHLIGPGFGGELFQGMALAPDNFNLVAQNQGIENFIRTARDAGIEVPIEVTYRITRLAVPMADGGFEYLDVLTGASYTISRPQSSAPPLQVIFELEEPPSRAWRTVRNDIPTGAPGADVLAAGQRPPP